MTPKNPLTVISWEDIDQRNQKLCDRTGYQHGYTSDGFPVAVALFAKRQALDEMSLPLVVDTMRELHKAAPFLFLNGNTFAELGSYLVNFFYGAQLTPAQRSAVFHHIAGTEILSFEELEKALTPPRDHSLD